MAFVASELAREGFTQPLLIGGATTSRAHTAVRIAPAYPEPVVHVQDASRAVAVASSLLSDGLRPAFVAEIRGAQEALRKEHASQGRHAAPSARRGAGARGPARMDRPRRRARPSSDSANSPTTRSRNSSPVSTGRRSSRPGSSRGSIRPSSRTRSRAPRHESSLPTPQALLHDIVANRRLEARAVLGFFPASRQGSDDIALYADDSRGEVRAVIHTLRQQMAKADGRANRALADYVAPRRPRTRLPRPVRGDDRPRPGRDRRGA